MHKTNHAKALQLEAAQVNPAEKPVETERPARFSIRNRDQASTKVRYVELAPLLKAAAFANKRLNLRLKPSKLKPNHLSKACLNGHTKNQPINGWHYFIQLNQ